VEAPQLATAQKSAALVYGWLLGRSSDAVISDLAAYRFMLSQLSLSMLCQFHIPVRNIQNAITYTVQISRLKFEMMALSSFGWALLSA
jgi:hypothetical protein